VTVLADAIARRLPRAPAQRRGTTPPHSRASVRRDAVPALRGRHPHNPAENVDVLDVAVALDVMERAILDLGMRRER